MYLCVFVCVCMCIFTCVDVLLLLLLSCLRRSLDSCVVASNNVLSLLEEGEHGTYSVDSSKEDLCEKQARFLSYLAMTGIYGLGGHYFLIQARNVFPVVISLTFPWPCSCSLLRFSSQRAVTSSRRSPPGPRAVVCRACGL